jgi:LysM repeat protein
VDGVYHVWQEGEGLNGVSEFYGVTPDAIIDFPANHLDRATLGNLSLPNIAPGTRLVVPGGTRPETLSPDSLLTYAASRLIRELPLGTPESFPAPRKQIIAYEVQQGETLFSIAEKFGLEPETILWANRYLIGDTPDGIYPGQKLFILPSDGVLHGWSAGENLDVVAKFYEVSRDVILNEPLNGLNVSQFADLSHPNIKPGTMLFIPGGTRPPAIWVTYVSAGEDGVGTHPNVSYLGSFACNSTATAYGTGAWQFPTTEHWISGYEFTPPTHNGLDYAGRLGNELYAADTGVIIYAGWSNRGYGNTVVIDHGNGYLSLYAHIMDGGIAVNCGQVISLGQLIGYMGSTGNSSGPHLHFEIRYNGSPINPHDFGL